MFSTSGFSIEIERFLPTCSPTCIMISPNVLNIPRCTHYIPPMYSLYPPGIVKGGFWRKTTTFCNGEQFTPPPPSIFLQLSNDQYHQSYIYPLMTDIIVLECHWRGGERQTARPRSPPGAIRFIRFPPPPVTWGGHSLPPQSRIGTNIPI